MDNKEEILEQLRDGLSRHQDYYFSDGAEQISSLTSASISTIDLSELTTSVSGTWDHNYGAIPNITISGSGTGTGIWTTTGTNPTWTDLSLTKPSGKITLTGEDADIEINGESLTDMIRGIQERLNILCPDPDMEAEWDELRVLREQYDAKLEQCREKSKMWKTLKSMPPPEVK